MANKQINKKSVGQDERSSMILDRVKRFASLAMVAGSLTSIPSAHASVGTTYPTGSIGDRVAKIRQAMDEKVQNQYVLGTEVQAKSADLQLAQWGNSWANWNNWSNWGNWNNWHNWINWGNFY